MAKGITAKRQKDARFLLDHVAEHGTRGFNVTQKTNAVNDSTTREVIRSLKQRLDALQQVAVVLAADIDGVRHMLSLLDTKLYGEEVQKGQT